MNMNPCSKSLALLFLLLLWLLPTLPAAQAGTADFNNRLLEKQAGENWYGLYFSGGKVGYMRIAMKLEDPALVKTEEEVSFRLKMMGQNQELSTQSERTYERVSGSLLSMKYLMKSESSEMKVEIVRDGAVWRQTSVIGGTANEKILESEPENIFDAMANEAFIAAGKLVLGEEISAYAYDPGVSMRISIVNRLSSRETRLFGGLATEVLRFDGEIKEAHLPQTAWYDLEGRLLEMKVAGFLTALIESKEQALSGDYLADFMAATVVKSPRKIENQNKAELLRVVFEAVGSEELKITSPRQRWTMRPDGAAELLVTREKISSQAWKPAEIPAVAEFLSPDERIQSGDARVIEIAKRVTQGSVTVEEAAARLMKWVYEKIRKKYTPSFTNALDVLESMEGDCGEHSVLFVALARAAGIQAREVTGIVYVNEIGGFGFHAWAEVLVGGEWLSVDPAWGQFPADVTHIAFARGGLAAQMKIAGLVGSIAIREIGNE